MNENKIDFYPCAPGFITSNGSTVVGWMKDYGEWWPCVYESGRLTIDRTTSTVKARLGP